MTPHRKRQTFRVHMKGSEVVYYEGHVDVEAFDEDHARKIILKQIEDGQIDVNDLHSEEDSMSNDDMEIDEIELLVEDDA